MAIRAAACGVVLMGSLLAATASAGALADDPAFGQMLGYKVGGDAGPLKRVEDIVVQSHGQAAERQAIEAKLIAALASPKATTDAKRFVCRMLVNAGTAKSVPALAALLPDEELSHMGLYALARLTCPEAGKALRGALGKLKGKQLVGAINALGDRQDAEAVGALVELMKSGDAMVREAAIAALGKIGGRKAATALLARDIASSTSKGHAAIVTARIRCADRCVAMGDAATARATYEALYKPHEPIHIRAAALRGLIATSPKEAIAELMTALRSQDAALRRIAIGIARDFTMNEAAASALAAELPKLPPDTQVLLLDALADGGQRAARDAVLQAIASQHETVRAAAIAALAQVGDASAVPTLVKAMGSQNAGEAGAARTTLDRLPGKGVNEAILKAMAGAGPKLKVELIKCLAARRAEEAVPALLEGAADPDKNVAREAFNALRTLASEDALAGMVALLLQAKDASARGAAERAVLAIAGKVKDESKRIAPVLAALPKADPKAKGALLRIASNFGGAKALAAVRGALRDPNKDVRGAALRALADWPDAGPTEDLLGVVKTGDSLAVKVIALRGYVRMLALPSDKPATEILKKFEEAMALAPRPEDKKLILSGVADIRHPAALKMLEPYLNDKALGAEAKVAVAKIKKALSAPATVTASVNANKAKNAIDGNKGTRWDTGRPMQGGEWFLYELPVEHEISGLELEQAKSPNDHPRGYEVYISRDGKAWGKPVAKGQGTRPVTKIGFKPTYGRFIKIVQTGKSAGNYWSIHTMKVHSKLAAQ